MDIKIKKLHPNAKLPAYAQHGDAGMDLFAAEDMIIGEGTRAWVPTGVAMEIPVGYVGLVWDKSGLSMTHGIKTVGGVIDAGYRGEIKVGVINLSTVNHHIGAGHKIAQMLIQKIEVPALTEVDELSDTARGESGFGSTGK